MRQRFALCLAVLMAAAAAGAFAAPGQGSATSKPPAAAAAKARPKAAKGAAAAKTPAKSARAGAKTGKPGETRTLQDIHIEGEIPVPQVLFITARDQRRFVDFQTQRYLKTSQEVGTQTAFPSRIVVIGSQPTDARKETRP